MGEKSHEFYKRITDANCHMLNVSEAVKKVHDEYASTIVEMYDYLRPLESQLTAAQEENERLNKWIEEHLTRKAWVDSLCHDEKKMLSEARQALKGDGEEDLK